MKIEDILLPNRKPVDAKDFDIEKWRQENPMDYLVAARLLMNYNNPDEQDIVFQMLWQVAQLHIPGTLYKYYSLTDNCDLNEKKLETLQKQKIFLAEVKDFNDPFDCKGFFYNPNLLSGEVARRTFKSGKINDFSYQQRVASLTENGIQSMPMWAHYANNHTGFCVSYDMNEKDNTNLKGTTFPVQYTDQRIDISSKLDSYVGMLIKSFEAQAAVGKMRIDIDDNSLLFLIILLCNLKHSSWAYEKEFRCTQSPQVPGMPFVDAKPKEIFIGINCRKENADRLHSIGETLGIPVHQMVFDEVTEGYHLQIK